MMEVIPLHPLFHSTVKEKEKFFNKPEERGEKSRRGGHPEKTPQLRLRHLLPVSLFMTLSQLLEESLTVELRHLVMVIALPVVVVVVLVATRLEQVQDILSVIRVTMREGSLSSVERLEGRGEGEGEALGEGGQWSWIGGLLTEESSSIPQLNRLRSLRHRRGIVSGSLLKRGTQLLRLQTLLLLQRLPLVEDTLPRLRLFAVSC